MGRVGGGVRVGESEWGRVGESECGRVSGGKSGWGESEWGDGWGRVGGGE